MIASRLGHLVRIGDSALRDRHPFRIRTFRAKLEADRGRPVEGAQHGGLPDRRPMRCRYEGHAICSYLINRSSAQTFGHAGNYWSNS